MRTGARESSIRRNSTRTDPAYIGHARSWLLVRPTDDDSLATAAGHAPDCLVIDLEDGVPFTDKNDARRRTKGWLTRAHGWVRVNDVTTTHFHDDVEAIRGLPGLSGVVLAKTESTSDIKRCASALPDVPIVAMIESAHALIHAAPIADTAPVVRLAFGVGDFRHDTGIDYTQLALAYARAQLVVASRAAALAGPIDGPCPPDVDTGPDIESAHQMGMTAKLAVDPNDIPAIHESLTPTRHQLTVAAATIERLGPNGEHIRSGADLPKLAAAHALLRKARHFDAATASVVEAGDVGLPVR